MNLIIGVLGPFIVLLILFSFPISLFCLIYFITNYKPKPKSYKSKKEIQEIILLRRLKKLRYKKNEIKFLIKKLMWLNNK